MPRRCRTFAARPTYWLLVSFAILIAAPAAQGRPVDPPPAPANSARLTSLPTLPLKLASSPPMEVWQPFGLAQQFDRPNGVGAIAVDPRNSDIVYASDENGSSGDQLHRTTDGGKTWQVFWDNHAGAIALHPTDPNTVYTAPGYGDTSIYKTVNGGAFWLPTGCCLGGYGFIDAVVIDSTHPDTVYAGVSLASTNTPGVYRTTDGGAHWSNLLDTVSVNTLLLDPTDAKIIYAAATDPTRGGVYKSVDAGLNWTRVMTQTQVNALTIDPQHPQVLYAATEGNGIFKSTDGGLGWAEANVGLSRLIVRALAIDWSNPRVVYAGLWEGGVFRSADAGASWSAINTGLTNPYVMSLATDPSKPYIVYAGTDGGGIFRWIDYQPPVGVPYAHITDIDDQPVVGAQVYRNGNLIIDSQGKPQLTDRGGNLVVAGLQPGDTLVALLKRDEHPTARQDHAGWAYRVYTTNMIVRSDGSVQGYTVADPTGPQHLVIKPTNPLVLFNLVVSIEWDATDAYLAEIARAVRSASGFLYTYTDGQMAFGQVSIYDTSQHWADADIQIATTNVVRPHAYVGGLTDADTSHVIRLGRRWDGVSGSQGAWDQPEGYRTLGHEFGHYALSLYDEYFGYARDQYGNVIGMAAASCTGRANHNPATASTNASVMDYQYTSSKLAMRGVAGLWSAQCQATAQWQLNGESDWETVLRKYADTGVPARWRFTTPQDRGGVLNGPVGLPQGQLNLPLVDLHQAGTAAPLRRLTVKGPDGSGFRGAIVALYRQDGHVIGQGFSDNDGQLDIYGASAGDTLRAASFDGGLSGSAQVGADTNLTIALHPFGGIALQAAGEIAHLRVVAEPSQNASTTNLLVSIYGLGPNADPSLLVTAPADDSAFAPTLNYSAGTNAYQGQVSFNAIERGTGRIQMAGGSGALVRLHSTYRLQHVTNSQSCDVYSDDGDLSIHLDSNSLPGADAYLVVMSPGALPGRLPNGLARLGDAYDVTASGAIAALQRPASLSLRYDQALVGQSTSPPGLAIYRWNPNSQTWQIVPSSPDDQHKALVASVTALGTYALLAPSGPWARPTAKSIFLPITAR